MFLGNINEEHPRLPRWALRATLPRMKASDGTICASSGQAVRELSIITAVVHVIARSPLVLPTVFAEGGGRRGALHSKDEEYLNTFSQRIFLRLSICLLHHEYWHVKNASL